MGANTAEYTITSPNGNLMRLTRGPDSLGAPPRAAAGLVGWTDEGQPFDAYVGDFSAAFETALGEAIQGLDVPPQAEATTRTVADNQDNAEMEGTEGHERLETSTKGAMQMAAPTEKLRMTRSHLDSYSVIEFKLNYSECMCYLESGYFTGHDTLKFVATWYSE